MWLEVVGEDANKGMNINLVSERNEAVGPEVLTANRIASQNAKTLFRSVYFN
jgi:hypothetical protein